jgi:hypothetical protein
VIALLWYLIGRRIRQGAVVIGRMEIREEVKTTTAGTVVLTRKENKTRTGEVKTEEQELVTTAEVQVMEVRSCFYHLL